jgi:hypothetical protein
MFAVQYSIRRVVISFISFFLNYTPPPMHL